MSYEVLHYVSFYSFRVTWLLLRRNISFINSFSNTIHLYPFFVVIDKVSHWYKTSGKTQTMKSQLFSSWRTAKTRNQKFSCSENVMSN
jgi:hypothetical protein